MYLGLLFLALALILLGLLLLIPRRPRVVITRKVAKSRNGKPYYAEQEQY